MFAEMTVEDGPTIDMTPKQLDNVAYSVGQGTLLGNNALIVVTADAEGGRFSVRPRRRGGG